MKTERKSFDCVEMMDRGALSIYEVTKDMTVEEELAYWRLRQSEAIQALNRRGEFPPDIR